MLLAYEEAKKQVPSDQEMREIVTDGRVKRLHFDLLTLLDQIEKANRFCCAMLGLIPAFLLKRILFEVVHAGIDGVFDVAGTKRYFALVRMLWMANPKEKEPHLMYGLILYNLDVLSHSVRKTDEWERSRILFLLEDPSM
ncbi:hypothetical protein M5689_002779 [Euphorbia peplus]|nr:hypothetical protein M5689_002779 [Euphorbia peplus]